LTENFLLVGGHICLDEPLSHSSALSPEEARSISHLQWLRSKAAVLTRGC